jgi:O-antigen ligase
MRSPPAPRALTLRARAAWFADLSAAGVAALLPWSTSLSSILIAAWLVSVLPVLNREALRRELMSPAGGLPVLLWLLAAVGMLWADVSWSERMGGLAGFHKLLLIPLLLARYRETERGAWVLIGYLASCAALLMASVILLLWPNLKWSDATPGVVVKDYIIQSGEFVLCAFGLFGIAIALPRRRKWLALGCAALAMLFLIDVFYIATGRTTLVVIVVLAVLFAFWHFDWRIIVGPFGSRAIAGLIAAGLVCVGLWLSSATLRSHLTAFWDEVEQYRSANAITRAGERLEYWRKSSAFVAEAPFIGHGTGSIRQLFQRSATGQSGASALVADNPHNQVLAVAIQLGVLGIAVLYALWIAHLRLFRSHGIAVWLGLTVVVQNVVSCLFNSHLADFTQGWTYVFGVGVLGGMVLRQAGATESLGLQAKPQASSGR